MNKQTQAHENAPNIFTYASKELSQDAMICWLVACAKDADPTSELHDCGMSFVRALLRSGESRVINARSDKPDFLPKGDITEIEKICPQYKKIDVFFQVKWGEKFVSVIVEDKTQSEAHGGQLDRYKDAVKSDNIEEDYIKLIYFKSGYVYGDEREKAENAGYCVIDACKIVNFFDSGKWISTHDFVRDFANHVAERVDKRRKLLENWDLNQGFVQWELMTALKSELGMSEKWPSKDFNKGGGASTQYPHHKNRNVLYWRIDSWKPLRLMVHPQKIGKEIALASWDDWERAFKEAAVHCGLKTVKFRRKRMHKGRLVWEGTIGAVDVRNCLKSEGLDNCVKKVCELHNRFIGSVSLQL
ncbi:MAG: hypothetical protein F4008_07270 [Gammaproteobacteria bacterium]|nr:hypothetical protein [Gammaproteobacteria bacterium]MYL13541.1 hypothetical protein [Gammaproteobacteria bacterium]